MCVFFQLKCLFGSFYTPLKSKLGIHEVNLGVRTNANIALEGGVFFSLKFLCENIEKKFKQNKIKKLSEHLAVSWGNVNQS